MTRWQRLRSWLRKLLQPTLVRRLMLAQLLVLTLLWSAFVAFVIFDSRNSIGSLKSERIFQAVSAVTESLAHVPQQRTAVLKAVDLALREDVGGENAEDRPNLAPSLVVRQGEQILYQTRNAPIEILADTGPEIKVFHARGMRWRARTMQQPGSDLSVTMIQPSDEWNVLITFNSNGYYLLPLLISLPFLLLPAWLSLRLGLRPWRKMAGEVAARGPHDLAPLRFRPKHLELSAMVDSINEMMRRVDESAARERSFIADAAHELRTPLAAMRINVEALQGQTADPRQQELLSGILNSGNRATRLVSQLLMLMRSDAGGSAVERQPQALERILQDRLASLSALARRRQIELELSADTDVTVLGNRESLESLIDNLIENAIKYSPPHSTVAVHLHRGAGEALLSIADHGPGIPVALRERVFDRFYRAPDQSQIGSGLGLAIARAAVLLHGGGIRIQDNEGGGTRISVNLPLHGKEGRAG